jgi:CRISPR system Cascade subunit CasB
MSKYLEELRKCKARDDRGMMANLRCILVDNKKHRAWPALNRLGVPIKDEIQSFIAGLYALHPEETSIGNFGTTCREIENKRGETLGKDNKLTPTERRFQHVLVAERDEICSRVLRMAHIARALNVRINYSQLASDLKDWGDDTKTKWAAEFWTTCVPPVAEEDI